MGGISSLLPYFGYSFISAEAVTNLDIRAMTTETCEAGNSAAIAILRDLPPSQGRPFRHKCAVCAYTWGYQAGFRQQFSRMAIGDLVECKHGKKAPSDMVAQLHGTQGGERRHQCVACAYAAGFQDGGLKAQAAEAGPTSVLPKGTLTISTPPPTSKTPAGRKRRTNNPTERPGVDYLKLQRENSALGDAGEGLVIRLEKDELARKGRTDLADKVEHTAKVVGDTAGYDISSFDAEGNKRFIEVKTTTGPAETPFYLSANELDFGNDNSGNYFLYRVFAYDPATGNAKVYISHGSIATEFSLTPIVFSASRKPGV